MFGCRLEDLLLVNGFFCKPAEQSSEVRIVRDHSSHICLFCLFFLLQPPWLHLRTEESEVLKGGKALKAVRWRLFKVQTPLKAVKCKKKLKVESQNLVENQM